MDLSAEQPLPLTFLAQNSPTPHQHLYFLIIRTQGLTHEIISCPVPKKLGLRNQENALDHDIL